MRCYQNTTSKLFEGIRTLKLEEEDIFQEVSIANIATTIREEKICFNQEQRISKEKIFTKEYGDQQMGLT